MKLNLALLAAAATGIQIGVAIAASRLVVAEVPPLTLALLRYAIVCCCLLPFFLKHFMTPALDGRAQVAIRTIAFSD